MTRILMLLRSLCFARKTAVAAACLCAVMAPGCVMVQAQNVVFSSDLTPPSPTLVGPQVTTGPGTSAVNLGAVPVCPTTGPNAGCTEFQALAYAVHFTGGLGATKVVTQGAAGLDFQVSYSSCTGLQEPGGTCIVGLTFTPLAPGVRRGAVIITDSNGYPVATTFLYGTGTGPAIGFTPAAESNVTTGPNHPQGVAVDAQGNIFYTDGAAGTLVKVPYNGNLTQVVLDSGFSNPSGVALDGAGNIYVADTGHNIVLKVPPGGGPGVAVGTALSSPSGVAVDGIGNVFISNPPISYVVEVPLNGGPQVTVGGGYAAPTGIAVDGAGNLFVADTGNRRVVKVPPNGAPQQTIGSGFHGPVSVAVDTAGNVFVGDSGVDYLTEVPADGSFEFPLGDGFITPSGMALGASGNLYIADLSRAEIVELNRSTAPSLAFKATAVGAVSSDSPQFVTAENIGNAPLTLTTSTSTLDPDFVLVHGPTALPYCTGGVTVASGSGCVLPFSFQPKSIGTFTSAYVLSDNALNSSATQSIGLTGTGVGINPQLQLNFAPQEYYGTTLAAQAISNSPGAITYSLVSGPATVSAKGSIKVTGEGLVTVLATQAASGNYAAATATGMFAAVQAGTTTTLSAEVVRAGFGRAAKLTVVVHPDTSGTPTGMVYLFDGSTLLSKEKLAGGTATYKTPQLTPGTHMFAAVYEGDANFAESLSSGVTVVVEGTTVTLHVVDTSVRLPTAVKVEVHIAEAGKTRPHGKVEIFDGGDKVDSFRIAAAENGDSGVVSVRLGLGTHVLTAVYKGDVEYEPGVSAAVTVTVK